MKKTILILLLSFGSLFCSATDDYNIFADKKDSCLKAIAADTCGTPFEDSIQIEITEKADSLLTEFALEQFKQLEQERETHSVKTYTILSLIVSLIVLSIINSHIKRRKW